MATRKTTRKKSAKKSLKRKTRANTKPSKDEACAIPLVLRDKLITLLSENLPMKTVEWAVVALRRAPTINITVMK